MKWTFSQGLIHYVFSPLGRTAREAGAASSRLQSVGGSSNSKLQHIGETHLPPRQVGILSSWFTLEDGFTIFLSLKTTVRSLH